MTGIGTATQRGQLSAGTMAILRAFQAAKNAIARVLVPAVDLYPDGAATIEKIVVNAATTSAAQNITFVCAGFIVGVTCSVQLSSGGALAAADLAAIKAAIVINGSTNLFQTGQQAQGFVSFTQLGLGLNGNNGIFRLMAPIVQQVPYQVLFKNDGASNNLTVDLSLWYVNTSSPPLTD